MNRNSFWVKIVSAVIVTLLTLQCSNSKPESQAIKIIFLHHSTGDAIWKGGSKALEIKGIRLGENYDVPKWFGNYNKVHKTNYQITEQEFPKNKPYGWENFPFDYYNIWVKNAGAKAYMEEPTLEMLTSKYDVVIFKHCYPVGDFSADTSKADINSNVKTIQNYKLQYLALKNKLQQFPDAKFIVWTGAVRVQPKISEANALLSKQFFDWVRTTWDTPGDNIFLWDFYSLETEGSLYMKPEYATTPDDSHPNKEFAQKVAPYFCQRIVDVITKNGNQTNIDGTYK